MALVEVGSAHPSLALSGPLFPWELLQELKFDDGHAPSGLDESLLSVSPPAVSTSHGVCSDLDQHVVPRL